MTEIVEPEPGNAGPLEGVGEGRTEVSPFVAAVLGKDEWTVDLHLYQCPKNGARHGDFTRLSVFGISDVDKPIVKVDVVPLEMEDFASSHPRV